MMREFLAVFIGGGCGASLRYACVRWLFAFEAHRHHAWSPIMLINVLGSFIMGVLYIVLVKHFAVNAYWRGLLMVGLLGGFTTFSSFSLDAMVAIENGNVSGALFTVLLSVVGSLSMCFLGIYLAKIFLNYVG